MIATCPIHNVEMEEKEGQYGSYFSHTIKDEGFCNGKRIKPFNNPSAPSQAAKQTVTRERVEEPDWEGIARGKTRCAIICAVIEKDGLRAALEQKAHIELAVSFVMDGLRTADEEEVTS